MPDTAASSMFLDSLSDGVGSSYRECQCGIEHYAIHAYNNWNEDPLEIPPESSNVKHHDATFILSHQIDGRTFVDGCDSCRTRQRRYEDFIWNHRDLIRDYLKIRIDQEKSWADQEKLKNLLAGIP